MIGLSIRFLIVVTNHETCDFFLIELNFDHCFHLSDFFQGLALYVCALIVFCLNVGGVSGPCVDVCWIIKYKFDMMLFNDSVSFSMEDFSNYAALVYDVVSIFCLCVLYVFVGGWFGF